MATNSELEKRVDDVESKLAELANLAEAASSTERIRMENDKSISNSVNSHSKRIFDLENQLRQDQDYFWSHSKTIKFTISLATLALGALSVSSVMNTRRISKLTIRIRDLENQRR